jgi:hypothetical protein
VTRRQPDLDHSGYPHYEEAERFGRLVMPYFLFAAEPAAILT